MTMHQCPHCDEPCDCQRGEDLDKNDEDYADTIGAVCECCEPEDIEDC